MVIFIVNLISFFIVMDSRACLNVKSVFPRNVDSHVKDKMVARPSYL